MPLQPGLSASVELVVTAEDTASALRSGSVDVLATPRVVALCEEATCLAVRDHLGDGETTVGMRVQLDHLAPTHVGSTVKAEATLEKVASRRLTFAVSVSDDAGLIAAGKITRVLVDATRFLDKAR